MGGKTDDKFVLFLKCSEDVCAKRILERGKTSGRTDDTKANRFILSFAYATEYNVN